MPVQVMSPEAVRAAQSQPGSPGRDLPALTVARFVAAFAVVCFHFVTATLPVGVLRNILASGSRGVAFFFVLSGFILTFVYAGRNLTERPQWRDYAVRRFARIYPVYAFAWLMTGAYVVIDAFGEPHPLSHIVRRFAVYGLSALLLVQSWIPGLSPKWNWPGWSLSVEAFFYLLFPLLLATLSRQPARAAVRWLLAALVVHTVLTAHRLTLMGDPLMPGTVLATDWYTYLGEHPLSNLPLFVMGVAMGRLYLAGYRIPRPGAALAVTLLLLLLTLAAGPRAHLGLLHRNLLLPPEFALIIFLLAQWPESTRRSAAGRFAVLLGKASYALYMIQIPCALLYGRLAGSGAGTGTTSAAMAFALSLVALSIAVHLMVEVPAERLLKRLMGAASSASSGNPQAVRQPAPASDAPCPDAVPGARAARTANRFP